MRHAMQRSCRSWLMLCPSARPSRKLPAACTSAQCGLGPEGRRTRCTAIHTTICCARYQAIRTAAAEPLDSLGFMPLHLHTGEGLEVGLRRSVG